jgi:hypothetical protein
MTHICRFIVMVLISTISARAAPPGASDAPNEIRPAKVEITGRGFDIRELRGNTVAFSMRTYVWSDVPPGIEGLHYTQMMGGGTASIHLKAVEAGNVFVAIAASRMLDLKELGWTLPMPDRSNTFTYADVNQTTMIILSRKVAEGEEFDIPQLGWTGTILLMRSDAEEVQPAR